jgi:phosphate transport system permease protein
MMLPIPRGRRAVDVATRLACLLAASVGAAVLFVAVGHILVEAAPALGPASFGRWLPMADPPRFGIAHAILSTLWVTGLGLLIAVPLGIGLAFFLSEVAPRPIRAVVRPCLDLTAGIPSVVYGFFGWATIVRWSESVGGMATGETLLAAGIVLAVMMLPFIAGTATEAFQAVPSALRESAWSLGITRAHLARRIVFRAAAPGLFAAVILGAARALGETLAVLMVAGNSTAVPRSPFSRGQPLTALIATELGETPPNSAKYHALFVAALVLLLLVALVHVLVAALKVRMVRHAA